MVSFQQHQIPPPSSSLLPSIPPPPPSVSNHQTCNKTITAHELFDHNFNNISSSKKRKHDQENFDIVKAGSNKLLIKKNNTHKANFFYDIEFELEKPLPLEWQRCLDIQSGKVHFYNTRTQKRTCTDPRQQQQQQQSPPDNHHHHMSLELELNLPYDQSNEATTTKVDDNWTNKKSLSLYEGLSLERKTTKNSSSSSSSSWISNLEVDDHREMVAAVCMRCHMLVMLCKATPSCPNCKFIYPPEQTPISSPNLCNKITKMPPRLTRLLCSKD